MEKDNLNSTEAYYPNIYDKIRDFLFAKYDIKYNKIAMEYEIKDKTHSVWIELNINSLVIELNQRGIKAKISDVEIFLKSDQTEKYNPIINYFENLPPWDGLDYIQQYASAIPVEDSFLFYNHLKKWLVRAMYCIYDDGRVNKNCIVLNSAEQNLGKTSAIRKLIPNSLVRYYSEDIGRGKDNLLKLASCYILNIEELDKMEKSDINLIKAMFSKAHINERLPYERKATNLSRITSFIASTNDTEILTDETGSVRFVVFEVLDRIDFNLLNQLNIDNVWSQAYYLYQCKDFNPELTTEELHINSSRNNRYTSFTTEQELIMKYLSKSDDISDFKTATDIMEIFSKKRYRTSRESIGRALRGFHYKRIKHASLQVYGYLAKENVI